MTNLTKKKKKTSLLDFALAASVLVYHLLNVDGALRSMPEDKYLLKQKHQRKFGPNDKMGFTHVFREDSESTRHIFE